MTKLSVVIPAYNEEKRIESTLKKCLDYLNSQRYDFELIVVDDGSSDKTAAIVKKFKQVKLVNYGANQGKGHAVKIGILNSTGDYVLFCDADLSTPIEEVGKLLKFIKDYDVVIASRALKESNVKTKFYRRLLGRGFAFIVNLFAVSGVKDTQCGFKLFKNQASKKIFVKQLISGWAFDVEVLFLARKFGYKIKEVPVRWMHFDHAGVNPTGSTFRMLREIFKIRINSLLGKYK